MTLTLTPRSIKSQFTWGVEYDNSTFGAAVRKFKAELKKSSPSHPPPPEQQHPVASNPEAANEAKYKAIIDLTSDDEDGERESPPMKRRRKTLLVLSAPSNDSLLVFDQQHVRTGSNEQGLLDAFGGGDDPPVAAPKGNNWVSHGPESSILLHGGSNAPLESENTLESDHVVQERLRQEEERQTRNSEELKNKHRVEVEREEEDRKVEEQMRVEEVCMLELEQEVQKKEDHRKQEVEEAARRTPDQILQQILRNFSAKTQGATLAEAALRQNISTMQGERVLAGKQERFAAQQISQAEKQQMEAAEQEDFELADQLAAVIEDYQREQEEKSQTFEYIIDLIEDHDYKRSDLVKGVWKCFENIQKELKIFIAEQENSDITDGFEVMKRIENNSRKLAAENERLSADLKNIERDDEFAMLP
jgi:hypothetical protein